MKRLEELQTFPFLKEMLNRLDIGTLSTYPPCECGIATFTQDLVNAMQKFTPFSSPAILAVNDDTCCGITYSKRVKFQLAKQDLAGYINAALWVNESHLDGISIQHEHGIYGGNAGSYLTEFLCRVRKPVVTTLHTVLTHPSDDERRAVRDVFRYSHRVVTMVEAARAILDTAYGVDTTKLRIIPHGVPNVRRTPVPEAKASLGLTGHRVISTFGLLSRGKGIEYAIQAAAQVVKRFPDALYLVLGQTHPNIKRTEGEAYRESLKVLASELCIVTNVRFIDRYLPLDEIVRYLQATDVYVTPYPGPDQISSGTLSYALGCGKAIVSTPYVYARSILGQGRGLLAEFNNAESLADGILRLLADSRLRTEMEQGAFRYGRRTTWHNVAIDYLEQFHALNEARSSTLARRSEAAPRVPAQPAA